MPVIKYERRAWTHRDRSGNAIEHFDVVETWVRMPGVGVWVLVASAPASEMML